MKSRQLDYDVIFSTELATIGLVFEDEALIKLAYLETKQNKTSKSKQFDKVKDTIKDYLAGKSKTKIQDIAFKIDTTDFQKSVLQQLQKIPYGETRTYGDIATLLKTSPRAVGNACRNNPLPIIFPCHRVVAANGIGGYYGAIDGEKLDIKSSLLSLEGVVG